MPAARAFRDSHPGLRRSGLGQQKAFDNNVQNFRPIVSIPGVHFFRVAIWPGAWVVCFVRLIGKGEGTIEDRLSLRGQSGARRPL